MVREAYTIESVGREVGLRPAVLTLYTRYVEARFPNADPGYWNEWAERFRNHTAMAHSDDSGRAVLLDLLTQIDDLI